jgi:hypothetical protein
MGDPCQGRAKIALSHLPIRADAEELTVHQTVPPYERTCSHLIVVHEAGNRVFLEVPLHVTPAANWCRGGRLSMLRDCSTIISRDLRSFKVVARAYNQVM